MAWQTAVYAVFTFILAVVFACIIWKVYSPSKKSHFEAPKHRMLGKDDKDVR